MSIDRTKLYESLWDFFKPSGHAIMALTSSAAIGVCSEAATHQYVVLGIEGGIHDGTGFEPRLDCIWNGVGTPIDQTSAHQNNLTAAQFIRDNSNVHNAFIITVAPLTGYMRIDES
jgi:Colicin-E5 Imm protein